VDFALRAEPLPSTGEEARGIAALLKGSHLLLGAAATESAVKRAHEPSVLHIATHGFFLADQDQKTSAAENPNAAAARKKENPLLRSGLLLAGVNDLSSGKGEDGVLTALEVSGLDLHGTQLVVLSACETGLGDIRNGDGVYGLRRALILAGSLSQVMSLWKVDDQVTRDLMIAFYRKLLDGASRDVALRNAQLDIRAQTGHEHPFYWASFIPSGDPGPVTF
jgi:CHAT domain-containing protein